MARGKSSDFKLRNPSKGTLDLVAQSILHSVLDRLETEEARLLSWGDTGGLFSKDEVLGHIRDVAPEHDPEDVLDAMSSQVMVHRVSDSSGRESGYRSRMGEAVHLFRNLRQWFVGQSLFETKALVSDFRFVRRPRAYPRRNIELSVVLRDLEQAGVHQDRYEDALREQVGVFRLSGFQNRATQRILRAYEKHSAMSAASSGTIVCSGTGSGKTLAFYLPGMAAVVDDILRDANSRVRVLAIYPRKELLKDQFNEARLQCRQLNPLLKDKGQRSIRIGALYSETPELPFNSNRGQGGGGPDWVRCHQAACSGCMRWLREDASAGLERLTCSMCGATTQTESIALTRSSMRQQTPDIVFTTTEMLNIHLANPRYQKMFGLVSSRPPFLVLLDEVHTYSGNHGAQVAYLLRRWMRMAKASPHFVGLSATLTEAEEFFSRLTGVSKSRVRLIEATSEEMVEEGAEYLLALRGDPVSQTALLSTTIQSAMLIRRVLDHPREKVSKNTWGTKTFVFTDNLDVTNRLFWQMADAEGWKWDRGRLVANRRGPLAALRNPAGITPELNLHRLGQHWGIAKEIGYSLEDDDRAKVARTSSQDSGVDSSAEIIVATASLEVGYNDSDVGAVLQHKAPRDTASYIQRKGRAGRPRGMRPWTIAVLSDFGRDRLLYQNYEQLISPNIKLQRLPLGNSHIYRMQAAMAALDWFSLRVRQGLWTKFNFPQQATSLRTHVGALVDKCMRPGPEQDALKDYISTALGLKEDQLERVIWQSPRSIFLEFLPLIRRRLETNWAAWDRLSRKIQPWAEVNASWRSPVPEHIPDQLFSDLNLPTLNIMLTRGGSGETAQMAFFHGLQEFAPGRISKRFSLTSAVGADWLVPEGFDEAQIDDNAAVDFEVDEAFTESRTRLGTLRVAELGAEWVVSQPHFIKPKGITQFGKLSETSNARLVWKTLVHTPASFEAHAPPKGTRWSRLLKEISFFLHRSQTQLEVVRFSTGARAELKYRSSVGGKKRKIFDFIWTESGKPAGIGTRLWVDAARYVFDITTRDLENVLEDPASAFALRAAYFQDGIRELSRFKDNVFMADWVYECVISAIALEAQLAGSDAETTLIALLERESVVRLSDIPSLIFQTAVAEEGEEEAEERAAVAELEHLLIDPALVEELRALSERLHAPLSSMKSAIEWARQVLAKTLAAGIHNAVCVVLPDTDEASMIADSFIDGDSILVYVSEQESGGSGAIAQLHQRYSEDPIAVLNIFAQALEPSEYEQLDEDIRYLVDTLHEDCELEGRLADVRMAKSFSERVHANESLKRALRNAGFHVSHSFSAVLYSRVLRPGSDRNKDLELRQGLRDWETLESSLGFELPLSVAALVQSVKQQGGLEEPRKIYERACRLQGLLWPRGGALRQSALQSYNRFDIGPVRIDRAIFSCLQSDEVNRVYLNDASWLQLVHEKLLEHGRVELRVGRANLSDLNRVFAVLQSTPLESYGLYFYPRLSSIKRDRDEIALNIDFAEAVH